MDIDDNFDDTDGVQIYPARTHPHSDHTLGVVDGDTYNMVMDLEVGVWKPVDVRAEAIDTAEIYSPRSPAEKEIGEDQKEFVQKWFAQAIIDARDSETMPSNWPFYIRTEGEEGGYGRLLCQVYNLHGDSLERDLIDEFGDEYLYE